MKTTFSRVTLWLVAALFLVSVATAQTYTAHFFGDLGGGQTSMVALNNNRVVVGQGRDAFGQFRPIKWHNGILTDLGALPGALSSDYGIAEAVNNSGHVVGSWTVNGSNVPFHIPPGGSMTAILYPGWVSARALSINENGVILCSGNPGWGVARYLYDTTTSTYFLLPGGITGGGNRLSDAMLIPLLDGDVYDYATSTFFNIKPSLQGTMYIRDLNSLGLMVGSWDGYNTNPPPPGNFRKDQAFIWRPLGPNGQTGRIEMIPYLTTNSNNYASAVNCWGWAVGIDQASIGGYRGFLYKGCSTLNLNDLKPSSVTAQVLAGQDINDAGDILVETNASGATRYVLFEQN